MPLVSKAQAFDPEVLVLPTPVQDMIINQHRFPHIYASQDELHIGYLCNYKRRDFEHYAKCFEELGIAHHDTVELTRWIQSSDPVEVIRFIVKLGRLDQWYSTVWTGYRILLTKEGLVPRWTFQLFSPDPEAMTPLYSGLWGPNVETSDTGKFIPVAI